MFTLKTCMATDHAHSSNLPSTLDACDWLCSQSFTSFYNKWPLQLQPYKYCFSFFQASKELAMHKVISRLIDINI